MIPRDSALTPPHVASSASSPHPPPTHSAPDPRLRVDLQSLLDRPQPHRTREYQYRFAQSVVFGLPVLALQLYGRSLGGPEAGRWVAILQALLAGWVVYVGAMGMLFEGLIWLARRRVTADLLPAAAAVLLYLLTLARLITAAFSGRPLPNPWFHWAVLLLALWTGLRWWHSTRRADPHTAPPPSSPP